MEVVGTSVFCCSASRANYSGPNSALIANSVLSNLHARSGFLELKSNKRFSLVSNISLDSLKKSWPIHASYDNHGSMDINLNEEDDEYVNSSVTEAVEVRSGSDGFVIKMRDGKNLRCVHNNPQGLSLPDYAPHPAIVLKMEDGSGLLLPIIVMEAPSVMLMAAIRNVQIARPTMYQVVKEMIEKLGFGVVVVRITKRVHEAYFAQLYLTKVGDEKNCISFDLRPSDAINIAVRCKVPVQVNKHLACSDGMRVIAPPRTLESRPASRGLLFAELDRPDDQPCIEAVEFDLVRNMLIAAVEERYKDAARYRDRLYMLRTKNKNWA